MNFTASSVATTYLDVCVCTLKRSWEIRENFKQCSYNNVVKSDSHGGKDIYYKIELYIAKILQ